MKWIWGAVAGSVLLITHIDQNIFYNSSAVLHCCLNLRNRIEYIFINWSRLLSILFLSQPLQPVTWSGLKSQMILSWLSWQQSWFEFKKPDAVDWITWIKWGPPTSNALVLTNRMEECGSRDGQRRDSAKVGKLEKGNHLSVANVVLLGSTLIMAIGKWSNNLWIFISKIPFL